MTDCSTAWSIIESRQWSAWRSLPGCPLTDWHDRFPTLSADHGVGKPGSALEPAELRRLTLSAYDHPLEVWSRDGAVVMVSVE